MIGGPLFAAWRLVKTETGDRQVPANRLPHPHHAAPRIPLAGQPSRADPRRHRKSGHLGACSSRQVTPVATAT